MTTVDLNPSNPPFRRSFETIAVVDILRRCPEGETVTYQQITDAMNGLSSQGKGRHHVSSAREILESEGIFFRCVTNTGYQRLPQNEAVTYTQVTHKKRLKNDTKRFRNKLEGVDPSKLTEPQARQDYQLAIADLTLREAIASKPAEKVLKEHISNRPAQGLGTTSEEAKQLMERIIASGFKG
jgi:hypothetical protein